MNFLPISIIAYALNGGSILVDKILIKTSLPKPLTYTFYVNLLQILALFLIPFGFALKIDLAFFLAVFAGLSGVFAFYTLFSSLKHNEASIVGPLVGAFNPLFALILGGLFLGQILSLDQYLAFFLLMIGALVITANLWRKKGTFSKKFIWIVASGFFFGLSYVLIREAFLQSNFLNGFIVSRVASALIVLFFLIPGSFRKQIISFEKSKDGLTSKRTLGLLIAGQVMGGLSVTLITFGVSLASPALVNSLFGVQYLVILIASFLLAKKHPQLLDEDLKKNIIIQKIIGAVIISIGLYLLAK
ncbi:MAG: DMT family transporter [Candidatus Daviesbacteria bacterium]|nr:DMT family transporter [Candidatus Daviesbacteria bacterium]